MKDIEPLTKAQTAAARTFAESWVALEMMGVLGDDYLEEVLRECRTQVRHQVRSEVAFARMQRARIPKLKLTRWDKLKLWAIRKLQGGQ
jgi:hypothetical protein